ncbi:MAG TPA: LEA type 2 family protein [Syntrophales bacterium]|nr:LEA type 2 family protein [Syntrophales bacterium]
MHRRNVTIFLCALLITGCAGLFFEEPTIILKEIHVRQISLTDASIVFVAEIQNPNSYDLRLKSLDYTVHLSGYEAGDGSLQKEIPVPASSSVTVEIPVSARFGGLGGIARMYISGQEIPYRLEGNALVKAGLFDRTFPFSRTGNLSRKKS